MFIMVPSCTAWFLTVQVAAASKEEAKGKAKGQKFEIENVGLGPTIFFSIEKSKKEENEKKH